MKSSPHDIALKIARLVIQEGLGGRDSKHPAVGFTDPVQCERFEKLLDEWLEAATE